MYLIIFFIIILLISIHVRTFFKSPEIPSVLELPISSISTKQLLEKQPIVIKDNIVNASFDLPRTIFKGLYLKQSPPEISREFITRSKYTILSCLSDSSIINIRHDSHIIQIKLNHHQCIILPPWWHVYINGDVYNTELHDPISMIVSIFHKFNSRAPSAQQAGHDANLVATQHASLSEENKAI